MNLKEQVTQLLTRYDVNAAVKSSGYGEIENYDNSKGGFEYPRAYLHTIEGTDLSTTFSLTVTDKLLATQLDRLDKESSTLTLIKELVAAMKGLRGVKYYSGIKYEPTGIYMRDSSIGWSVEFEWIEAEDINTCNN